MLKITVPKVTEKTEKVIEKVIGKTGKVIEKVPEQRSKAIQKMIERVKANGDKMTENKVSILNLIIENPYVTKAELAKKCRNQRKFHIT